MLKIAVIAISRLDEIPLARFDYLAVALCFEIQLPDFGFGHRAVRDEADAVLIAEILRYAVKQLLDGLASCYFKVTAAGRLSHAFHGSCAYARGVLSRKVPFGVVRRVREEDGVDDNVISERGA